MTRRMKLPEPVCSICKQTKKWHEEHKPHHTFQTEGGSLEEASYEAPTPNKGVKTPFDPVLRFLLIKKGIITPDELSEAETMLRSTGFLETEVPSEATNGS